MLRVVFKILDNIIHQIQKCGNHYSGSYNRPEYGRNSCHSKIQGKLDAK